MTTALVTRASSGIAVDLADPAGPTKLTAEVANVDSGASSTASCR